MKSPQPTLALAAAVLLGIAGFAAAQQGTEQQGTPPQDTAQQGSQAAPPAGDAPAKLDRTDRKFIEKAAMDGMAEVELGRLAQGQGQSEQVRQFGARMQQDHSKANAELMRIAEARGVALPAQADRKAQKKVKELGKHSGAEFDRRYVAQMEKEHEKDLKLFQDRARNSKDPDVRAFAEKNAQVISAHLEHVKQLSSSIGGAEPTAGMPNAPQDTPQAARNESRPQQ